MSESNPFVEIVGRILDGKAPANMRAAAAHGALPLPRPTLVRLQIFLLKDPDEEIRDSAKARSVAATRTDFSTVSIAKPPATISSASFVTLKRDGKLRGCLGTYTAHRPRLMRRLLVRWQRHWWALGSLSCRHLGHRSH